MIGFLLYPILGGALGYGYYRLIGCSTGACPLTSNPVVTVIFGAVIGLTLAFR